MNPVAGKRVLVVEDEFIVADATAEMLQDLDATIVGPAGRLADGLALARSERIDVAVLDINLHGERSDPIAAILRGRGIPFVLTTGYGDVAGVDAPVVDKPYTDQDLLGALARALR